MALMTDETQEKLVALFQEEGLVAKEVLDTAAAESKQSNKPLLGILTEKGHR